jgi:hypothetical protein
MAHFSHEVSHEAQLQYDLTYARLLSPPGLPVLQNLLERICKHNEWYLAFYRA